MNVNISEFFIYNDKNFDTNWNNCESFNQLFVYDKNFQRATKVTNDVNWLKTDHVSS
jgi:hypothetical protein